MNASDVIDELNTLYKDGVNTASLIATLQTQMLSVGQRVRLVPISTL